MAEAAADDERSTGTAKWFSPQKGYGFIAPDDGGEDIFIQQTSIRSQGFRMLSEDQPVEFSVDFSEEGCAKAVDVVAIRRFRRAFRGGGRGSFGRRGGRGGYGGGDGGGGHGECHSYGGMGHLARDCYESGGRGHGDGSSGGHGRSHHGGGWTYGRGGGGNGEGAAEVVGDGEEGFADDGGSTPNSP